MKTVLAVVLVAFASLAQGQALKKVVLFGQPSVNNDAIWMALEHGYFKEQGLEVEYRVFPSGTTAFQTFRTGQGDIVMTGDLPSVQYFFNNPGQYQTFAAIERDAKGYVVIARKDIRKPQDLAGKIIATRVGSTGSWFISEYPASAIIKNLDTQLLPAALCNGDIAAFFIWQPIGSRTLEICPKDAHQLSDATGYIQGYLVAGARPEYLNSADGADRVQRFLRAILKGRDKAEKDFAAVAAYAAKPYSLSEKATRDQWDTNTRPIALDKVYYEDFCSLSKWAQREGITKEAVDFSKLTWPNGLRAINPKFAEAPPAPC